MQKKLIKESIIALLKLGFEVDLFGILSIHQLEDGRCRIFNSELNEESFDITSEDEYEEMFDDVEYAVEQFLKIREIRRLGYDFEDKWHEKSDDRYPQE
jgi:hypothetical protein